MNYNIIHNNSLTIGSLLGIGIIITSYLFITNEDVHNDIINEDVQNDIINEEVKNDIVESYGNFVEIGTATTSSSGISIPNSSSNCMINSTVSSESAPKSSMNFASTVTLDSSTPNLSITISLTLSKYSDML